VFEFFGITEDQMPTLVLADMGAESGIIIPTLFVTQENLYVYGSPSQLI
jgi:hypothetical protein